MLPTLGELRVGKPCLLLTLRSSLHMVIRRYAHTTLLACWGVKAMSRPWRVTNTMLRQVNIRSIQVQALMAWG